MIDSQPSPSRPRVPRPAVRRQAARREPLSRREVAQGTRRPSSSAIVDPALAELLAAGRRPQPRLPSVPPPPPPLLLTLTQRSLAPSAPTLRLRADSVPDSAVTQPMPQAWLPVEAEVPAASFTPVVAHARPVELSVVAALSVAVTLAFTWLAQTASHWGEVRAQIATARAPSALTLARPRAPAPASIQASFATPSTIPIVRIADLPLERLRWHEATGPMSLLPSAGGGVTRAQLQRGLSRAAQAARSCGPGPVHAQIVATFGPSGVPRAVHFGAAAPPRALRSCVLSAVARTRVAPFSGEPVTVSKNLAW